MNAMADDSAEIFDDLYLGLRAGGALRKQRRGESLTEEEQEALGRWQRLSPARKALAIGGFALRTFGPGSTPGTSWSAGSTSRTTTSTSVARTAAIGIASRT